MARVSFSLIAVVVLSAICVVHGQQQQRPRVLGWDHYPSVQRAPYTPPQQQQQQQQQQQYRPQQYGQQQYRAPQQPRHWQYQPQRPPQAPVAPTTTPAPTPPVEVEPPEIEGPTTTPIPTTLAPAFNYGQLHGPGHGHATAHVHQQQQQQPQNPFSWQARPQQPLQTQQQRPQQPAQQQSSQWAAQRATTPALRKAIDDTFASIVRKLSPEHQKKLKDTIVAQSIKNEVQNRLAQKAQEEKRKRLLQLLPLLHRLRQRLLQKASLGQRTPQVQSSRTGQVRLSPQLQRLLLARRLSQLRRTVQAQSSPQVQSSSQVQSSGATLTPAAVRNYIQRYRSQYPLRNQQYISPTSSGRRYKRQVINPAGFYSRNYAVAPPRIVTIPPPPVQQTQQPEVEPVEVERGGFTTLATTMRTTQPPPWAQHPAQPLHVTDFPNSAQTPQQKAADQSVAARVRAMTPEQKIELLKRIINRAIQNAQKQGNPIVPQTQPAPQKPQPPPPKPQPQPQHQPQWPPQQPPKPTQTYQDWPTSGQKQQQPPQQPQQPPTWPMPPQPPQQPPQSPPQQPPQQPPQGWPGYGNPTSMPGSGVMPQQAPSGSVKTQAVRVQPTQQNYGQQHSGYYQPPQQPQQPQQQQYQQQYQPQQQHYQQQQQPQQQQQGSASLPKALDPFNPSFNEQAFSVALMMAKTTQPPPPQMGGQGGYGWGGQQGGMPGQDWAGGFGQSFVMTHPPTTPPPPPPTTPDHKVKINPYRLGGFYVGPNPAVAKKKKPPPEPVIIEIPQSGATSNPFNAFMGETPPPPTQPTTPMPGRNGDYAAGWLGFHEAQSTPPPRSSNDIGGQQFAAFFPVPMDSPQQNTAQGPSAGPGGWDMGPPQPPPQQAPPPPQPPQQQQQVNAQVEQILSQLLSSIGRRRR